MEVNKIYCGDCQDILKTLPGNSVDSICCDPPYELGFMGKSWDSTGIANNVELWRECLRVLKPGGHLLAFSGTRTYHRMASAIEDAGFEVRDMIEWVYSTGFPKSLNVYKQLEKKYGEQKAKYCLRPLSETNISQEISNRQAEGKVLQSELSEQGLSTEGVQLSSKIWEGQPSVEGRSDLQATKGELSRCEICQMSERVSENGEERWLCYGTPFGNGETSKCDINKDRSCPSYRPQSSEQSDRQPDALSNEPSSQEIRRTKGIGTALKPSHEPICMARKPLEEKTVAQNVLKYGTGGINIDESRVGGIDTRQKTGGAIKGSGWGTKGGAIAGSELGRFPANLVHDNSGEVRECFPEQKSGARKAQGHKEDRNLWNKTGGGDCESSSGNASRFFKSIIYQAKASKSERGKDNRHPTIKPIALMEYLIKMVTPKGGIVLDPFTGSGSTLVAAKQNGFDFIGIELSDEYIKIAEARLSAVNEPLI